MVAEKTKGGGTGGLFNRLQEEIEQREQMEGLSPADLLDLSDELRAILQALARRGELTLAEVVLAVDMAPSEVSTLLASLEEKGFVLSREVGDERVYKTYFGRRRGREVPLDIWEALSDKIEK